MMSDVHRETLRCGDTIYTVKYTYDMNNVYTEFPDGTKSQAWLSQGISKKPIAALARIMLREWIAKQHTAK